MSVHLPGIRLVFLLTEPLWKNVYKNKILAEIILQGKDKVNIPILRCTLDARCANNVGSEVWAVLIISVGNDLQNIHVSWQLWQQMDCLSLTIWQIIVMHAFVGKGAFCRCRWPHGLRPSVAGIAVSNPAGGTKVCCECCVLLGRGLCDGPISHPNTSYRACMCY
jgi:hypothetical protein